MPGNESQAIPTIEFSPKTVVISKEQNLWVIESFAGGNADQRTKK
jgi:hypothetical protein